MTLRRNEDTGFGKGSTKSQSIVNYSGRGCGAVVRQKTGLKNQVFVHQNGHNQAHTLNRINAQVNENKYYLIQ